MALVYFGDFSFFDVCRLCLLLGFVIRGFYDFDRLNNPSVWCGRPFFVWSILFKRKEFENEGITFIRNIAWRFFVDHWCYGNGLEYKNKSYICQNIL